MKRHRRLWALSVVGVVTTVAVGILSRRLGLSALGKHLAVVGPPLTAIGHSLRVHTEQLTAAQLVQAAVGAWLIFLLLLVLLARSRGKDPSTSEAHTDPATNAMGPEQPTTDQPPPEQGIQPMVMPPLPLRPEQSDEPSHMHAWSGDAESIPPTDNSTPPPDSDVTLTQAGARHVSQSLPDLDSWPSDVGTVQPLHGHTVALTGVIEARERLLSYGLFVAAEDTRVSDAPSRSSQRASNVIVQVMAPVLTGSLVANSAQRSELLKLAVLHANLNLREERIRTATALDAAVTVALVMDNVAQIVSTGSCRTHLFRAGSGLVPIPSTRLAMPSLTGPGTVGPLDQHVGYMDEQAESGSPDTFASRLFGEVEVGEVRTQPDDLLLLTTPRLWHALHQSQVESILRTAPNARVAARSLAREATSQPGDLDFGVIVVRAREDWMPGFGIAVSRPIAS